MSILAKSAMLSLSLLAGVSVSAFAQSDSIAALPPAGGVTAPARIGPSGPYPGPDPGRLWGAQERQTRPVTPSQQYVGPDPGRLWGAKENQTLPVAPSPNYVGPSPDADTGGD